MSQSSTEPPTFDRASTDARHSRVPRAGIDPIDHPDPALALIDLVRADPPRHQILAIGLDPIGCGLSCLCVDGTDDADAVVDVAALVAEHARRRRDDGVDVRGVVLASIRPGATAELHDGVRWHFVDELLTDAGLALVEWFVIGRGPGGVTLPRHFVSAPAGWFT
ncbi:MAG: hypothetical protein AAFP84_15255 [Actinomycetota bacterium]